MDHPRWERLAAGTGVVFVVLVVLSVVVAPFPPKVDDPIEKVTRYYRENRDVLMPAWYLAGIGIMFGLWFLGSLRAHLLAAEGGTGRVTTIMFASGFLAFAVTFAGSIAGAAMTFRVAEEGNPSVMLAMFDLQNMGFTFYWFAWATSVLAASIVVARTRALPRWFAWYGAVLVPVFLVAAAGLMIRSGPFAAGGVVTGGAFGVLASVLYLGWVATASVLLFRRLGSGRRPPAQAVS
jgi:hypothetical protein